MDKKALGTILDPAFGCSDRAGVGNVTSAPPPQALIVIWFIYMTSFHRTPERTLSRSDSEKPGRWWVCSFKSGDQAWRADAPTN